MSDVIRRSISADDLDQLVTLPCSTLAALMKLQLPPTPELAEGLARLDEARQFFRLAAAMQTCPPGNPEREPP